MAFAVLNDTHAFNRVGDDAGGLWQTTDPYHPYAPYRIWRGGRAVHPSEEWGPLEDGGWQFPTGSAAQWRRFWQAARARGQTRAAPSCLLPHCLPPVTSTSLPLASSSSFSHRHAYCFVIASLVIASVVSVST